MKRITVGLTSKRMATSHNSLNRTRNQHTFLSSMPYARRLSQAFGASLKPEARDIQSVTNLSLEIFVFSDTFRLCFARVKMKTNFSVYQSARTSCKKHARQLKSRRAIKLLFVTIMTYAVFRDKTFGGDFRVS
jgi:hypothetical protein